MQTCYISADKIIMVYKCCICHCWTNCDTSDPEGRGPVFRFTAPTCGIQGSPAAFSQSNPTALITDHVLICSRHFPDEYFIKANRNAFLASAKWCSADEVLWWWRWRQHTTFTLFVVSLHYNRPVCFYFLSMLCEKHFWFDTRYWVN